VQEKIIFFSFARGGAVLAKLRRWHAHAFVLLRYPARRIPSRRWAQQACEETFLF
jgi:hypothetical protein